MTSYAALRAIITMSVTGSILAIIVLAVKPLIRDRLPKSTQYYLWLIVLFSLIVPVSKLITLPDFATNVPSISGTVDWCIISVQDILERVEPYKAVNDDGFVSIPEEDIAKVDALIPDPWIPEMVDWFRLVHYLGAAVYLAFILRAYITFAGKVERHNAGASREENALLKELCSGKRVPRLYRNAFTETPMVLGVFHPAIILPDNEYSSEQLYAVLLHELTHMRRLDVLLKWLSVIVTALHWYNPVVWLVRREVSRACELSCDEAVIRKS